MIRKLSIAAAGVLVAAIASSVQVRADTLRLLTWGGYAPDAVVKKFEAETGTKVEVTVSNNEDMISKLRATGGAGFDLAQPSQDRIAGPQADFGIYKPAGSVEDQYEPLHHRPARGIEEEHDRRRQGLRHRPYLGRVGAGGGPVEGAERQELHRPLQAGI